MVFMCQPDYAIINQLAQPADPDLLIARLWARICSSGVSFAPPCPMTGFARKSWSLQIHCVVLLRGAIGAKCLALFHFDFFSAKLCCKIQTSNSSNEFLG